MRTCVSQRNVNGWLIFFVDSSFYFPFDGEFEVEKLMCHITYQFNFYFISLECYALLNLSTWYSFFSEQYFFGCYQACHWCTSHFLGTIRRGWWGKTFYLFYHIGSLLSNLSVLYKIVILLCPYFDSWRPQGLKHWLLFALKIWSVNRLDLFCLI